MKHHLARLTACILLALAAGATSAHAAPLTAKLRIEGPTSTLYEGWVTTDVRPFHYTGDATMHDCDGTSGTGGTSPTPVVTRGTVMAAAIDGGLQANGTWFSFGPSFDTIAGQSVAFNATTNEYLVEYDHGTYASTGACSDPITNGEEVLFAYGDGTNMALSLTGPVSTNVGEPAAFVVRNAANNVGQSGATVGSATSDANGVAMVTFPGAGTYALKASKPGTIRSNAVVICVHNGNDGNCGYPLDPATPAPPAPADTPVAPPVAPVGPEAPSQTDTKAPIAVIAGLRNRERFARGRGPRELQGSVSDAGTVKDVQLRLQRKTHKRCFGFAGKRERFTRLRCSRRAGWFSIGSSADWRYLLPSRLGPGLYQLQVRATDAAGNHSSVQSLRFRVA